jgi:hypothetical protein
MENGNKSLMNALRMKYHTPIAKYRFWSGSRANRRQTDQKQVRRLTQLLSKEEEVEKVSTKKTHLL